MGFFLSMFICNMVIPGVMIVAGYHMYKYPPKEINGMIGYRTRMSRKSKETWMFAQDYCGRLWLKIGWILLTFSIIVQIPFADSSYKAVTMMTIILGSIQIITLFGSVFSVETNLRKKFDANGKYLS